MPPALGGRAELLGLRLLGAPWGSALATVTAGSDLLLRLLGGRAEPAALLLAGFSAAVARFAARVEPTGLLLAGTEAALLLEARPLAARLLGARLLAARLLGA